MINFLGIGDSIAAGHPNYVGPEEGGPSGNPLSQIWPYLETLTGWNSWYNAGIGGDTANGVDTRIAALLASKVPQRVYLHVGVNDVNNGVTLANYLVSIASIYGKVSGVGAELIINQIIPWTAGTSGQKTVLKQFNAALEDYCFTNNLKMCPTYQDMAYNDPANEDKLATIYDADGVHPTIAGYIKMANLMYQASVPIKLRKWGNMSYSTFAKESFQYMLLSAGASRSGNLDKGDIILPNGETADSPVLCIPENQDIELSAPCRNGIVNIYYRLSASNFARNDAASWTLYSGSFNNATDQFIQIRVEGNGNAQIVECGVSWGGDLSIGQDSINAMRIKNIYSIGI